MERETKTYTTPEGKSLVLYSWITVAERRKVAAALLKTENNNLEAASEAQDTLIEVWTHSYDGKSTEIVPVLLRGKQEEYDYILEQVLEQARFLTQTK